MKIFLRILKVLLICFVIIVVLSIIHMKRNLIIVDKIENNFLKTEQTHNDYFYYKGTNPSAGTQVIVYKKGSHYLQIVEGEKDGEHGTIRLYSNDDGTCNYYLENNYQKVAYYNYDIKIDPTLHNYIMDLNLNDFDDIFELFLCFISSGEYDGHECYIINCLGDKVYIEKETGLCLKDSQGIREYSFEEFDDDIFNEPDITGYKVYDANEPENSVPRGTEEFRTTLRPFIIKKDY